MGKVVKPVVKRDGRIGPPADRAVALTSRPLQSGPIKDGLSALW
jgi:hypothetical protein